MIQLIRPYQRQAWQDVLLRCRFYDTYHLPEYHLAVRDVDEGEPLLIAFEHGPYVAAIPLLIRDVGRVPELAGMSWKDASSAYGYPGLLTNCSPNDPQADEFRTVWQGSFAQVLRNLNVVTVFVRQHPLIQTAWMWQELGIVKPLGQTVVLDLRRSESEQYRMMRENHRRDLRKAAAIGMRVVEDVPLERLKVFIALYEATMRAVDASSYYFFPDSYFEALRHQLRGRVKLFFAELRDEVVAGMLFFHCGKVIQYHLGGSDPALGRVRAMGTKLIIDTVRRWGSENGFHWLHLGGGLGARQDSLFLFKAGFSELRCDHHVVNYVVDPEVYKELLRRRFGGETPESSTNGWFPAYRCPVVRRAA
ncbi:MAG: GNAT family N-acetyltransferase [Thermogutta sp.]